MFWLRTTRPLPFIAALLLIILRSHAADHQGVAEHRSFQQLALGFARLWGLQRDSKPSSQHLSAEAFVHGRYKTLRATDSRNPVIFIPPLTGVQLQIRLQNRRTVRHWWCPRNSYGWRFAWLNFNFLIPGMFGCFADDFRLQLDDDGRHSREPEGVQVRPKPGFDSAMFLQPYHRIPVYAGLAHALRNLGWVEGKDMVAHLYDWRRSPLDWASEGGAFQQLREEIEDVVKRSGRRVVAVSLSMGGAYFAAFLKQVTAEWKAAHVESLVSISGLWGGTPVASLSLTSGIWGATSERSEDFTELLRHTPSLSWLLPNPVLFGTDVIAEDLASQTNYSAADAATMLKAAGASQAAGIWEATSSFSTLEPLNITVHCFYSEGVPTPNRFVYRSADLRDIPSIEYISGDGTVPLKSMEMCKLWVLRQTPPVHVRVFSGLEHTGILADKEGFLAVLDAVVASSRDGRNSGSGRVHLPKPISTQVY